MKIINPILGVKKIEDKLLKLLFFKYIKGHEDMGAIRVLQDKNLLLYNFL